MTYCHDYEQHRTSEDMVCLQQELGAAIRERDEERKRANEWLAQLHDSQKRVKVLERALYAAVSDANKPYVLYGARELSEIKDRYIAAAEKEPA